MTPTPDRPAAAPDLLVEADVRNAARSLLRTPLLDADAHSDELALVRRHRDELTRLFADGLGYRLVVEPGLARLYKTGLGPDASRGLRRRNDVSFTPHRYALLALTLAALTQSRRQVMVDELVALVRSAAVDADIDLDLDNIHERRALHSALAALIDLGVLSERDGDLDHWAERRTESLLDVHRDRLSVLIAAPLGGCKRPEDVLAVAAVPSAAGGARVAVRRRLAEQPVLSTEDLTEEQRGWWRRNREREREWFRRYVGLDLELRSEGAVAIDPGGELTDLTFPGAGSAKHFALLLLGELVDGLRAGSGAGSAAELEGATWARVAVSTARQAGDRVFKAWQRGLR
ncbi:MAG: TIGR02678 family protein, partial [Nocardioidaceae bacterium]